ncbi:hypothetical protein HOD38_04740 [archaeon]|jgi:uncharacterized coiled-coil DUF342 family protein|nr:hypothetical protein [archaeon]
MTEINVKDKLAEVQKEITSLKTKLDELNAHKEEWFKKKEELKDKIAQLIKSVKSVKSNNDTFSDKIKKFKDEREKYNKEVRGLIKKIKEINDKKKDKLQKLKIKDPDSVKKQIAQLETNLETEALSFSKEKQLMKQIKDLKKKIAGVKDLDELQGESKGLSEKIDTTKKKAEDFHNKIKETLKDNKDGYKEFNSISKEINTVKKEQEDAFDKFITYKQEFSELNKKLREKQKMVKGLYGKDKDKKDKVRKKKQQIDEQKIEEKSKAVEEKIKKKKVLTTEDLIAFQGSKDD